MKLLYITNQLFGSGGLERVLSVKASHLAEHFNYEVHIVTLNQGDTTLFYDFSEKIIFHNIQTSGNKISSFFQYRKGLINAVKEIKPDLIAVCDDGFKGFFVPLIIRKPCPMIYERHASKFIFYKTEKRNFIQNFFFSIRIRLIEIGARSYDKFIVLTNENLKEWNLNNLQVIPNTLSFYPELQSNLNNKQIITVGNHGYQKGIDRLIKAASIVIKKYPEWKFVVFGNKNQADINIKLVKELNLGANIIFNDPVKNIGDQYFNSSIYALPSRSEGFGMVLIEAMAYGLPCVAFDCPSGPIDIISNNEDGFLIENGKISQLAKKINDLIEDKQLRIRMGIKARINSKQYLPEFIVPKWDLLFQNLLKSKVI